MPTTEGFPFRRLSVDHLVEGGTRVWWDLQSTFREPMPYVFQLQVGKTGLPDATDWTDVGTPVTNGYFAVDDQKRNYGKRLEAHYRVKLIANSVNYVSLPVHCEGQLDERSWLLAREILRKDALLDKYVSVEGWLLKRYRYGARCSRCLEPTTQQITDSRCPICKGTGFQVGYHPPVRMCIEMDPTTINELRNGAQVPGATQYNQVVAHVAAFPQLAAYDVWADDNSDLRYSIDVIKHTAVVRGVPLLSDITIHQLPLTDVVYRIGVGGEANDHPLNDLPTSGAGSVAVTHDYGGEDVLAYQLANGCGIEGATILAFRKTDYDNGLRTAAHAVASSTTLANGRWAYALQLDPGEYVLVYEQFPTYGPTPQALTVAAVPCSISSQSSSFSSSFGSF
jgi:Zn finger protein HypA/HybF involved in hydrogenase expression